MAKLKIKSNRGAAKRFRVTAKGGFKHRCTSRNHILTKKGNKRKRQLAAGAMVDGSDQRSIRRLLVLS